MMKSDKRVTTTQTRAAELRAALYLRVSTGRQAEHDLSIPDQRQQLQSWCRGHGYAVTAEFVEAGASPRMIGGRLSSR
jgi:DNA invertase Pin-like site-specific DNA recombinase